MASAAADGFFTKIVTWLQSTNVPTQIKDVDFAGLFTNPWFMVPFVALVGYLIWKQSFNELIIVVIFIGLWWVSGTEYMQTLVVDGHVQIKKILPVLAGASAILGFIIYLFFGRS
ncbi:hypothetical protein [Candidatus Electronema sp. PJ]|jgi:hypothetical protein|uniref:hypothetical protein n=1 Tax=Candidatus Electronema sp. PJ TaxID=3401572 RepID=UPI003AA983AC